ncbi:response regulator [Anaerocolumna sedimenticola]|uniref:Stage 0 sporulation protein A homolog n=1 Tax=Anaerocolumna sedimenticola TaxID=2696063 RepID=A0A6P1TQ38_9FIRM|nr:chemotaxis protein [Anaerocolumna sedimenticola]QHQ61518.1 response regulator [Anaerocolumna sedimenticola]
MNHRENKILLETGTNELEVLEFVIAGEYFGINVAKVRELIRYQTVHRIPHSQSSIEGIIRSRDELFTVVNLAKFLNYHDSDSPDQDILIITDFNKMSIAFHVHLVAGINRISWEMVEKPSSAIYGNSEGLVTGIAKLKDRIITLLDFEKIMYEIYPYSNIETGNIEFKEEFEDNNDGMRILIAEDSPMLNRMIIDALHEAGYHNIIKTSDGKEAWNYLQSIKDKPDYITCVITDIEMPQMDGHHLTKRIKEDNILSAIPVVIFSSLISDEMRIKGEKVGANAQLSKPEIGQLVQTINQIIRKESE